MAKPPKDHIRIRCEACRNWQRLNALAGWCHRFPVRVKTAPLHWCAEAKKRKANDLPSN